jgi:hypothetical protein
VERLFKTLQDRLVKAMRLAGISDIETANAWLPEYLAQHNARFAVAPQEADDAHLPFAGSSEELARLCAHRRRLSKDLVISFCPDQGAPMVGQVPPSTQSPLAPLPGPITIR